jgi:tryptophanyl-tRNA synthetase
MTQYKDKSIKARASNKTSYIPAGLLTYPTLMAADILLYDVVKIPVGQDQFQHLELTRNLAERFNNKFGEVFTVPQAVVNKNVLKIMDLQEPTKKMSKSSANEKSIIKVLDEPALIRKKIASAITDSENLIKYDPVNKPGVSNLLTILHAISETPIETLEKNFIGKNYKDLKDAVSDALVNELEPIQKRYYELIKSDQVQK